MKISHVLLAGAATLCATMLLSQTLPSTLPAKEPRRYSMGSPGASGEVRVFHLAGKQYRAKLTRDDINAGPDWRTSMPVPLTLAKAEEIARTELHKLVSDDSGWEVTELHLKRLRGGDQSKWYYVVELVPTASSPTAPRDSFFTLIGLSGKAGTVELDNITR